MDELERVLLESYMRGFNDELYGTVGMSMVTTLLLRAYELGRGDAIIGDDVRSNDTQTNEQILNRIKNIDEKK